MANLYLQLKQRQHELVADGKALAEAAAAENRGLTDEEKARDDAIYAQLEALRPDIEREERRQAAALAATPVATYPGNGTGGVALPDRAQLTGLRDLSLDRPWGWQWQQAGAKPEIAKAAAAGEWFTAVYRAGIGQGTDPRLLYHAAAQSAGEQTPADGGFLVGTEIASDIRLRMMTGQILRRVDARSLTGPVNSITYNQVDESSRATGSRFGGVQGYWVDEGAAVTASKPTFWKLRLELRKVMGLYVPTDELLADTVELGRVATTSLAEELRFLCEERMYNGAGAGSPAGIVGHAATVSIAKETGQAAATLLEENVLKMWARMYAPSRDGAVWHINQDVEPQLLALNKVIGTGGVPIFLPPGGLSEEPFSRLMGRPVIPLEYCPTLGTVGDISLVNWSEYRFVDKGGIQQDVSMHVYFTTDEMAFRAVYRADGRPKWRTALTPFKGTNTLSPFVTLATRA